MATGDGGREAYTAIAWGVGLSHERSDIAGAEGFHSLEGNMCGTAMRGADALPGSKATSRAKGSYRNLGGLGSRPQFPRERNNINDLVEMVRSWRALGNGLGNTLEGRDLLAQLSRGMTLPDKSAKLNQQPRGRLRALTSASLQLRPNCCVAANCRDVPQGDIRACSKSRLIGSRPHLEIADRRDRGCGPAGPDGLHHFGRWFRLKDG